MAVIVNLKRLVGILDGRYAIRKKNYSGLIIDLKNGYEIEVLMRVGGRKTVCHHVCVWAIGAEPYIQTKECIQDIATVEEVARAIDELAEKCGVVPDARG